jgi:hypothetical protein
MTVSVARPGIGRDVRVVRRASASALLHLAVAMTGLSAAAASAQPAGLVASYSFEETTGTSVTDASGLSNTGTLSGATRTATGKVGRALSFNGVTAVVNVPDSTSLRLTTGMTLEAWVYPTALNGWQTVVMKEVTGDLDYALYANEDVSRPSVWLRIGTASQGVAATPSLPLNTWTHLAATYNGSTVTLYRNGTAVASQARTGSIASSTRPVRIGGNTIWGEYFAGMIDEVRIYNRALSAAEITTDMNAGSAPQPAKLTITSPVNNATITGGTVNVTFASSGDLSQANHVRLSLDGGAEQVVNTLNGTFQFTNVAVGTHTLNGYIARADSSKITGSDATPVGFTIAAPPPGPQLQFTSPANNATLPNGPVTVNFTTTGDLTNANRVHILVDGGSSQTVLALTGAVQLNGLSAGSHTLTGFVARSDDSKITGSDAAPVTFTLSGVSPTDPSLIGQWSPTIINTPTVSVNFVLTQTNKAIFWAGDFSSAPNYGEIWNAATNQISPVPNPFSNIFCSANVHLADGRILVAGGHDKQNGILGNAAASVFDPRTETWALLPSMANRRWYPTLTMLGDGRAIVTAGSSTSEDVNVEFPEVYDPVANTWTTLTGARRSIPQYPMIYLLPDGRLLQSGTTEHPTDTVTLNVATQTWTVLDSQVFDGGSGVQYLPGKILKSGSASNDGQTPTASSTKTAYVLDMNQANPAWRQIASMAFPRTFHNLTVLADGSVIVTSGSRVKSETNISGAVLEAELWSPVTETWTTVGAAQAGRIYHSTALLLPDGRLAVSGSGNIAGAVDQQSIEIYSPPYLFKGARPTIASAPSLARYGTTFNVQTPDATNIRAVNLVRLGADTHNFDQDQRFVPLTFTQAAGGLDVQVPNNSNLIPPGYYMLFLVSNGGVPSVATYVRFPAPYEDLTPPTAPSGLVVTTGTGTANLTWTAATDNVGVARYEIHRSTVATFTPSSATLVGTSTTTNYLNTGVPAGTYYYAVVALDATGNSSPPSNVVVATLVSDTTAPTVAISAPAGGSTVTGVITVSATASDNVGVAGVQFRVDGAALGAEDTTSPFSVSWSSAGASNGTHVLTAVARDAAGNQTTSASVSVTVANSGASGLVAYYPFEEGTGTTTVDGSGSGNNGTLSGAVTWTTAGHNGGALSFDGIDDLVTVADANSLDLTTGMTLEAWVYPTALSGWRTVVIKEVSGDLGYLLYANDSNPRPAGYVRVGGSSRSAAGSSGLPLNTWTHLATTYDGATLRLYVNGTQVGSAGVSGAIQTSTLPLRIGGNSIWGEYFSGKIDEVRVYNRALSATEVSADMNSGPQTPRLTITSPTNGATVSGTTVSASFTSSGDLSQAHHAALRLDGGAEIAASSLNGSINISPVSAGAHTLDGYLVRSDGTKIAGSDAVQVGFTTTVPDTIKPTVVISAPRDGDTVTGSITITATATDNVGVAGVTFKLDGTALGAEDTTAPYSFAWATAAVTNGTHVLTALARDAAGNQSQSLDVNIVVGNATSPTLAGLVAAYGFEEGTGTTTADKSGNGNTGTLVNGTVWTTSGRFGNALQFDGSNDRVDVADANSLDLTTGMTAEAWVNPTNLSGWRTVVVKEVSGELSYLLYANDSNPTPAGYVRIGSTSSNVVGSGGIPLNTWTHLATTYDGATLRLYVNGTQVGSRALPGSIVTSNQPLRIGGNAIWGEYFVGKIDEVRVFNRALSASEIQGTMNAPVVGAQVVQPTRSTPIAVDATARRVWVVNPDSDTVAAINADTLVKQLEIPVGKRPTSVALDAANQVWITCRDDDTVWVLDATSGALRGVLTNPWGSGPESVVFTPNGSQGFIAFQGASRVQRITTPATRTLGPSLSLAFQPRALAVTSDGSKLLVTRLRSPDSGGEVYPLNVSSFTAGGAISMPLDTTATDGALAARGVPNYLTGIAIDPADGFAWVVGKKDNILRGGFRDGQPLTFETTVRALVGRLDLRAGAEQLTRRVDLDNMSSPSAVALSDSGALAFVAVQGNNRVVVLNQLGAEVVRADTGLAPQGVVIDPTTKRVFTQDFMSRTVTVFDASRLIGQNIVELPRVAQISTVATEKLGPTVLRGKQIFYNAADSRMSRDSYISCASCHLDAEHDGRVWDFTDRGEGLRNTISLKGSGGAALAPLHWTANFDEVQDFENDIRSAFGGTGLMADADFFTGTRSVPLGQSKAGLSPDLDALADYVSSLTDPGFSPFRQADGSLTANGVAGKALFNSLGCQTCHSGPKLSDSPSAVRHDVGTIKPSSGKRIGGPLDGFDTPTLLGLWATAPYLHDGSAPTLRDVLTTANPLGLHGATPTLTPAQIDQLAEFLNQIEPGTQ